MSEDFIPINTQEEFDSRIKERLERERKATEKKFEGYTSPDDLNGVKAEYDEQIKKLNEKYAGYDSTIAEKDKKIKEYETASVKARVARELDLPYNAVDFLNGEDEEAIKKSATVLKGMFGSSNGAPHVDHENEPGNKSDEAYKQVLKSLKNG